jgi:hypothetical protein
VSRLLLIVTFAMGRGRVVAWTTGAVRKRRQSPGGCSRGCNPVVGGGALFSSGAEFQLRVFLEAARSRRRSRKGPQAESDLRRVASRGTKDLWPPWQAHGRGDGRKKTSSPVEHFL